MSPGVILSVLVVGATVVGARFYTAHELRIREAGPETSVETQNYISALETQLGELEKENQALRSMATSGETTVLPAELIEFIEKDLGLEFRSAPVVRRVSEDMIAEAAGQRYLAIFSEVGMQKRSYAFEKLGIVPASQNFMGQLITAETNGSRGYYDITALEILLAEDFDVENVHHLASAARLLAIALLDEYSPLPMSMTDDAFHAREAVHRGRAAMVQARFYTINAKQLGFVAERSNEEGIEIFQSLAPYVQDLTTFPNIYGKTYIERLYQGDEEVALAALLSPPKTTREILAGVVPADYVAVGEIVESEETELVTRVGAVTVFSFLRQVLDSEPAEGLVSKFVSDSIVMSSGGAEGRTTTTVWSTVWESEEAAEAFRAAANDMAAAMMKPPEIVREGTGVKLTSVVGD